VKETLPTKRSQRNNQLERSRSQLFSARYGVNFCLGFCPLPYQEQALKPVNRKKPSVSKPVRWNHLPHEALSLEIKSRISLREALDTELEVAQKYLEKRLKRLEQEEHDDYINCVGADLKRELRICRDVYRDYLKEINTKSAAAKARVALDFAVAPMASRRLREEIIIYVRHVGIDHLMFAALFFRLFDSFATHPNFDPEWLSIEKVTRSLIPDSCFQELKGATSREILSLAAGPFGDPAAPFERLVINLPGGGAECKPNAIWDRRNLLLGYELWRLWGFVFHEVCDQHAAIDCEEKSNLAIALIALNPFEQLAGRMFYEASDTYLTHVPDDVFIRMGRQLDAEHISLADNLAARGREILKHLGRQGKPITTWEIALAAKSDNEFLPEKTTTRDEATTLRQFGTLSRCAKRAFYRAKEAYHQALERVYEQRVPVPINKNPFESKL
jgi:hypothetical protein